MTNKIVNFIVLDNEQKPVISDEGLPVLLARPDTKTMQDVERLIELNKPTSVINKFAELVSLGEQWDWAQSYYSYLVEKLEVEQYNENLPEPTTNEAGELIEVELKSLPIEPEQPAVKSTSEILAPYSRHLAKLKGVEHRGVCVTLNEANQNGLSALKSALELARDFDATDQFFPVNFNAETPNGVEVLLLDDEEEFKHFGFSFVIARKALFE
ncbi:hypothetical protein I6F43_08010 [Pseudoalteromonas sp. NZS71_1]|uniref:hypothetical protein n=1 Tax=Pseudoalteromonas sp. NZS71_1 TaxID=2792072 RepID=UPI0018CD7C18|nr:hypothetical protein [Pseudoalteromonas sp. NZS71_1]MBH0034625.1 hypothetical protein [Pseudoalteromonas sp. NZS71_1]